MLTAGKINGHEVLRLENDLLRISVLPQKGADIYEFAYKPSGTDFLLRTPAGLRPPGEGPQTEFLANYEGAWQELLPNVDAACDYRGARLPMHGEVALLPWEWGLLRDDAGETAIRCTVRCRLTPFRLERLLRIRASEAALIVEEAVTNDSGQDAQFIWGHHVVLGGAFLEAGCRIDAPARTLLTPDVLYEPATARLEPGQREPWPLARGRRGRERIDLRLVPGPEEHSHDDVTLADLQRGYIAVTNPRLRLRFSLEWDATLFRYIGLWQPLGGADLPPLTGIYGLGIEPWVSRFNLAQAIEHGEAITLGARQTLRTALRAAVSEVDATPADLNPLSAPGAGTGNSPP